MRSTFAAVAASALAFSTPAFAVTIADGGTLCESLSASTFTAASVGGCDVTLGDLSNTAPGQQIEFLGEGQVFGFVADRQGTNNTLFPDFARITFATDSRITFQLFNIDEDFDAVVSFGGVQQLVNAASPTASFLVSAGMTPFFIDTTLAPALNSQSRNGSDYTFTVSAVPLPAGMVLMLTALGGLAVARRKTKS